MHIDLGIVIPTKDRHEFIFRIFKFYSTQELKPSLYIGDSSNKNNSEKILREIDKYKSQINIYYFYDEGINEREFQKKLLYHVKENFCAYSADDDLIFTRNIEKYINFLKKNKSFRTCSGYGFIFKTKNNKAIDKIGFLGEYWQRKNLNSEKKVNRLFNFLINYWVTEFAIHRTKEYIEDFNYSEKVKSRYWGEILTSTFVAIRGYHKTFDDLYLARHVHDNRYIMPTFEKDKNFQRSYEEYNNIIFNEFKNDNDFSEKKFLELNNKVNFSLNYEKDKFFFNYFFRKIIRKIKHIIFIYRLKKNIDFKDLLNLMNDI